MYEILNKINMPKTVEKYMAMLDWAVEQNEHPVIIRQSNNKSTLINPGYLTGVGKICLENLKANHQIVITLEDVLDERLFFDKKLDLILILC